LIAQKEVGPVIAGAHTVQQVQENAKFVNSEVTQALLYEAESIVAKWQFD
jgi:aryl-alcohol dehydrogenase-like predicted oxidoreductase